MPLGAADIAALAEAIRELPPAAQVNAASIKLPEFWVDDPEIWFARVESQFNTRNITQDLTKFDYIVAALDNSSAAEVKAIILDPPANDKYGVIKKGLLDAFSKSQTQKDAELLSLSGLGDKKPTALLRKIRSLNSDAETLRRAIFLNQLPSDVRSVLAGQDHVDLDALALSADRIMEARQTSPTCELSPVFRKTSVPIKKGIAKNGKKSQLCFYHSKFGKKAERCQPGCLYFENDSELSSVPQSPGNDHAGR